MHNINIAKAGREVEIDFAALPPVSQAYIIKYGLTQCLNDAHASIKAVEDGASDKSWALVEVRLAQLTSGNPPSVGARAQSKPEWYTVAEEMLGQALKAQGLKKKDLPNLDELVRKLYALRQDAIDAEVSRRKSASGVDLKSLGL